MEQTHHRQFSWQRLLGLGVLTVAVMIWMTYLQIEKPPIGGDGGPGAEAWRPFIPAAIASVAIVVVTDIIVAIATVRRTRRLPEEERDWEGPDPHADRAVPVEAWSPSPIMQRAIKRTIAKQEKSHTNGAGAHR